MSRVIDRFPHAAGWMNPHPFTLGEFKVDLGNVERTIRSLPGVADVAVAVHDVGGEGEMTAYVTPEGDDVTPAKLEAHCRRRLPGYMVPQRFVLVARLPDLTNGVVDEAALLPPPTTSTATDGADAPQGEVLRIWQELLGRTAIGREENFFHIGGHSLLAVRAVALIEKRVGVRLPLTAFFKRPTLGGIIGAIGEAKPARAKRERSIAEIQPVGQKPPLFWGHTLGGGFGAGLFSYYSIVRRLGSDQPSYGFVATAEPAPTIEAMAQRYIEELLTIQPTGPYFLAGYCFGGVIAFEVARQLRAQQRPVAFLAVIESQPPNVVGFSDLFSFEHLLDATALAPRVALRTMQRPREAVSVMQRRLGRVARGLLARERSVDPTKIHDLSDLVDFSRYPAEFRGHAEAHWNALKRYIPGAYDGTITVFHTDDPKLLRPSPVRQWERLARSVVAQLTPGDHANVLAEPYVSALALRFRRRLMAAQRTAGHPQAPISASIPA